MIRKKATYAILRYVPSVLREEFLNVGVVLVCPELNFQGISILPGFGEDSRLKVFEQSDGMFIRHALGKLQRAIEDRSINEVLGKEDERIPLGTEDLKSLYAMYAANNLQLSPIRSAATNNPRETLETIYTEFVGQIDNKPTLRTVTKKVIRDQVRKVFAQQGLFDLGLEQEWQLPILTAPTIDFAYQNQVWHCYQAISFAGHERTVTTSVNAYRQAANDAREYGASSEIKKAKFAVLGHVPKNLAGKAKNLLEALKHDEIAVENYQDVAQLVQPIAHDLKTHVAIQ
jgi:Protein of unknown function (DUF3037)